MSNVACVKICRSNVDSFRLRNVPKSYYSIINHSRVVHCPCADTHSVIPVDPSLRYSPADFLIISPIVLFLLLLPRLESRELLSPYAAILKLVLHSFFLYWKSVG